MSRKGGRAHRRETPGRGGSDDRQETLKRTHELFNPEVELLAMTVTPHDKRTDLAGGDCKQVCPVFLSKTVIEKCARLTTIAEAQGHPQLAREVLQRVR